jgi:hypothetical protein
MSGMSPRQMVRGLREAIVTPIANDFRTGGDAIHKLRKTNLAAGGVMALFPPYAIAAGMQDASRAQTSRDAAAEMVSAIPITKAAKGLRALAREAPDILGKAKVWGGLGGGYVGAHGQAKISDQREAQAYAR